MKNIFILLILFFMCLPLWAQDIEKDTIESVSEDVSSKFVHDFGIDLRPSYVLPSVPFLDGQNLKQRSIRQSISPHLKYSFRLPQGSLGGRVYADTYQGLGVGKYYFGNEKELGNPVAVYFFQGARIGQVSPKVSLHYEWNFGLSQGWKAHDFIENPYNVVIGSALNAMINAGMYLKWNYSAYLDMTAGMDVTHFSNGNTDIPNVGINMAGLKVGILYHFDRIPQNKQESFQKRLTADYPHHVSYDLVVFGSWRRKAVDFFGDLVASPHVYPVLGAYFAPMYNFGYKFRAGFSIDGVYDGSANLYTEDYIVGTPQPFSQPPIDHQMALGVSARTEYIMPFFTINFGIGTHVLHKGGDLSGTYQTFGLKVRATRSSFVHIGYNLKDFHQPNFLMLGLGYRFNNKFPSLL